jgi:hypothetical protein
MVPGRSGLPAGLTAYDLDLSHTSITELPPDLRVTFRLNLEGCRALLTLPEGLRVSSLNLRECTRLTRLPEGLETCFLDLTGCTSLTGWPSTGSVRIGRLSVAGCAWVRCLPRWVGDLAQLDVGGCGNLRALPEGLRVNTWVEVADSGLTALPASMAHTQVRWRGVPIDARIAFHPETITAAEVLDERNAERRRVLLERMGPERFAAEAEPEVLDRDRDPGGERRLLRVAIPDDEDLVCLEVRCPSTGRQYLLRVPPSVKSCRQAAAWIAGFDSADDYAPVLET